MRHAPRPPWKDGLGLSSFYLMYEIEMSPFLASWRTLAFSDWLIHNRQVFYYVKSAAS